MRKDSNSVRRAIVLYQFFPPDDVVSSILFGDLASDLSRNDWDVKAYPCNRSHRGIPERFSPREIWSGVRVRRIWRPNFSQAGSLGRVFNAVWMLVAWSLLGCMPWIKANVVVVGTDPILGVLSTIVWKIFKPKTRIVYWCFDLYPEAAVAGNLIRSGGFLDRILRYLAGRAYRCCDWMVDIGPCMRERLRTYGSSASTQTIVPWALSEPAEVVPTHLEQRTRLFGNTPLALLYSGNLGRAHSYDEVFELARHLGKRYGTVAFAINPASQSELRAAMDAHDDNIVLAEPAPLEMLADRLSAADVHIVTLRKEWTGMVVPSKFFGALAIGRPVLFCGSSNSSLARWIREHRVGWVLEPGHSAEIAEELVLLISDHRELKAMFTHCHAVYQKHFSRQAALGQWHSLLERTVARKVSPEKIGERIW